MLLKRRPKGVAEPLSEHRGHLLRTSWPMGIHPSGDGAQFMVRGNGIPGIQIVGVGDLGADLVWTYT